MQESSHNPSPMPPIKPPDSTAFIEGLFKNASQLNLFTESKNFAHIINIPEARKPNKQLKTKSDAEEPKTQSIGNFEPLKPNLCIEKLKPIKRKYRKSMKEDFANIDLIKHENAHEIESSSKPQLKKAKNEIVRLPDQNESQKLVNLELGTFESDSESLIKCTTEHEPGSLETCFVKKETMGYINSLDKPQNRIFDFLDFIQRRDNKTRLEKVYACKYCPKVYGKQAALGGHTAKNHPQLSDNYKARQTSMTNRKIEKERFDFFKHL